MPFVTTRAELDAALAAPGGSVEIVCDSATPITLTTPVVVDRPARILGGHFLVPDGTGFDITSSDVTLSGVHIEGGRPGAYQASQKLVHAHGSQAAPLERVRVSECRLENSRGDNVWLTWCRDAAVTENMISAFLYSGVMVISGLRVMVANNLVRDAVLSPGVVNVYGIAITDTDNTEPARSRHCTVTGNHVSGIEWEGIDTHGGDRLTITGNHVTACPRGIALVTGNSSRLFAPTNCVVSGNTIDAGPGTRPPLAGVYLAGISGKAASATVVGNQITGYDDGAPPFYATYWARADTYIGGNSRPFVPWTPIEPGADYTANPSYPPEFMVDGNMGFTRGGVIPKSGGVAARDAVGRVPNAAGWPETLTPLGLAKGSNPNAGNAQLAINPSGQLLMLYGAGTDGYTYWLNGSWPTA